ncbi:MAG: hypothetical protein COS92_02840 [Desulfobacterales bacterium CG07_land_8_20_14_0_80_52_14]|nr:MAG: hypothetical protein COX20_06880 [Desulfobacterales bacterium CG23_combo_of_CG06-09_8_20_14_all_52_9]PIU50161.1 MAG: hypothetical protein COS92_02840 [Desulfobacterales bacterium CG07_land_8_20_14_0_80_52_14]
MKKNVYDKMLRRIAIWPGPCPLCGKQISVGDILRQPFMRGAHGRNRYVDYWVCYSCTKKIHEEMILRHQSHGASPH